MFCPGYGPSFSYKRAALRRSVERLIDADGQEQDVNVYDYAQSVGPDLAEFERKPFSWLKAQSTRGHDELSNAIAQLPCLSWVMGAVMPTMDVTPEALGTVGGGTNPVDPLAAHLAGRRGVT
jgi:hypothetical protein